MKKIKTFYALSHHLELEVECLEASKATKATKAIKSGSAYMANNNSRMLRGPKRKNYAPRQDSGNGPMPKKTKNTNRKLDERGDKGKNEKCFNCDKEGHFARDCTESRKVLPDFNSRKIFVSTHVVVAYSHPYWIVDSEAIEHVTKDRVGFIEYHRIPKRSQELYMGNGARV